jgi:hypothetical protein
MKRVKKRFEISKRNSDKQETGPTTKSNPMPVVLQMYGSSHQSSFTSLTLEIPEESPVSMAPPKKCQRITNQTTRSNSTESERQAVRSHPVESMETSTFHVHWVTFNTSRTQALHQNNK